jgi:hypothetical protein
MSEDIIGTDLTHEVPADRAVVRRSLKKADVVKFEAKMPGWLGGSTFKLTAQVHAGSAQSAGLTALLLAVTSGLLVGIASVIGVPALTALIIGLCVSIGSYTLIHILEFFFGYRAK